MRIVLALLLWIHTGLAFSQARMSGQNIQILFWNVENLFDIEDDSLTNDDEFVPYSMRGWNYDRYEQKLFRIYKTLVAAGGWQLPELVALAEIENRKVLEDLLEKTPLLRAGYQIIHRNSEDRRGIDVAVLYRPDRLHLTDTSFIRIRFPRHPHSRTRDILHLEAAAHNAPPFHIFVNHWPSRYGGGRSTESKRLHVASVMKDSLNALYAQDSLVNCIIVGDFNDLPEDASLQHMATAKPELQLLTADSFQGTHKHQGVWSHFDQVWVSKSLTGQGPLRVDRATVFHPEWLLKNDKSFGGLKPRRTYEGYRYQGGFSDHLPVYLELSSGSPWAKERHN